MSSIDMNIGARIARMRQHRGLTQAYLARCLGISQKQMRAYEKGKTPIHISRLNEIARWLECETAQLLQPSRKPIPRKKDRRAEGDLYPKGTIK